MNNPAHSPRTKPGHSGRRAVFSAIRQRAPVARIDIATATGLSPATVTSITADLLGSGLIEEVATTKPDRASNRGRPRVDLKIRRSAHYVAGLKLSDRSVTLSILDFEANVVAHHKHPAQHELFDVNGLISLLKTALEQGLKSAGLRRHELSAVGLGMPGIVDVTSGIVHWSPALRQTNVPLQSRLSAALGLPVFVDNDANLVALAEQRVGVGQNASNFVVVTVEQGIGLGIVINNQIYRGTNGCGAELGHTKVQLDGALCRCGQRGCLEAYVGDFALLREATTTIGPIKGIGTNEQIKTLLKMAVSGDDIAQSILARAGRMFSMGLANVANIFAPELIILSGERVQSDFLYADRVVRDMKDMLVQSAGFTPKIVIHHWDYQMWATGAAICAIEGVIEAELSKGRSDVG